MRASDSAPQHTHDITVTEHGDEATGEQWFRVECACGWHVFHADNSFDWMRR